MDCLDPVTGAVLSSGTGLCEDTGTCLTLPGVDQDDSDFMLSCAISTLSMPDHSCSGDDEVNVNAGDMNGSCTLADTEKMYLGTFIYHVHNSAQGAFTLSPETTSVAMDDDAVALTLTLSGVTLTVP